MVTDAAGTGFEIKKPHKGTETRRARVLGMMPAEDLKLRNPIRGRKLLQSLVCKLCTFQYLKLRNPIRGRKQVLTCR